MINRIKYFFHVLTDKYFIQVNYVEIQNGESDIFVVGGDPIPTLVEKKYIAIDPNDNSLDHTSDIDNATTFGLILGGLALKKLKNECKDLPNLQFELVSVGDAHFIDTIKNGCQVPYNNFVKGAIDFASDDLHKKYLDNQSVFGTGVAARMDTEKKIMQEWLEVHVKDEEAKKLIEKDFEDSQFKGFPIKVIIACSQAIRGLQKIKQDKAA